LKKTLKGKEAAHVETTEAKDNETKLTLRRVMVRGEPQTRGRTVPAGGEELRHVVIKKGGVKRTITDKNRKRPHRKKKAHASFKNRNISDQVLRPKARPEKGVEQKRRSSPLGGRRPRPPMRGSLF